MIYKKDGKILVSADGKLCSTCCLTYCDCVDGNSNVPYYSVTFTDVDEAINGTHQLANVDNCYWYKLIGGYYTAHLWLKENAERIGLQVNQLTTYYFRNINDDISECQASGSDIPNNEGTGTADFEPVL